MTVTKEPICPKCGGEVEYSDCYDSEVSLDNEIDEVHRHIEGHCVNCGVWLKWTEVYEYKTIKDLQITE